MATPIPVNATSRIPIASFFSDCSFAGKTAPKRFIDVSAAIIVALATLGTPAIAGAVENDIDEPVQPIDRQAAEIVDAKIIARKTGWNLSDVQKHMRVQAVFGDLLVKLAAKYPGTYSGGELAERPGGTSSIRFKGTVPADAFRKVSTAGIPVDLVGGSKYSTVELRQRSIAVIKHLAASGFAEVGTAVMPQGFIDVTVGGGPDKEPTLPPELRDDVRISVVAGPVARDEHTRGGAWVLDDGVLECTSGFAVTSLFGGETGVSTAGHCNGINQYQEPSSGNIYPLIRQTEHLGVLGDVGWYTSDHFEPAEYYASATDLREVNSVEPWSAIAGNSWYCVYGRSSNNRECDEVYSTFVNALTSTGLISSLVGMTEDNTIGGDSGGPWSFGTEATGGHRGDQWIWFQWRNVFSVADLFPVALGVVVAAQ